MSGGPAVRQAAFVDRRPRRSRRGSEEMQGGERGVERIVERIVERGVERGSGEGSGGGVPGTEPLLLE